MVSLVVITLNPYGQSKLLANEGIPINGIKWATRNVDAPGTFAENHEDTGMLYQWNRKVAYPSIGDVTDWNDTNPEGNTWEKANDPCPAGWRVPTAEEIDKLLHTDKVSSEWATVNHINGKEFTDKATGNSIFLPAAGFRDLSNGEFNGAGEAGMYWSCSGFDSEEAHYLLFLGNYTSWGGYPDRCNGYSIRCVAE